MALNSLLESLLTLSINGIIQGASTTLGVWLIGRQIIGRIDKKTVKG